MLPIKSSIIFYGSAPVSAKILQALIQNKVSVLAVISNKARAKGRGMQCSDNEVVLIAKQYAIPYFCPETLKDFTPPLTAFAIVIAYGKIIPKRLLSLPQYGYWNLHFSLLPKWRGASPVQAALLQQEKTTGISLMQMNEKMDEGAILIQETYPLSEKEDAASVLIALADLSTPLLMRAMQSPVSLMKKKKEQDDSQASYCHKVQKIDGKLNFSTMTATEILAKMRAYVGWPGVFFTYKGQRIVIKKANIFSGPLDQLSPGSILAVDKQNLVVQCQDGVLTLQALQLPGKKSQAVANLLQAQWKDLKVGDRLL